MRIKILSLFTLLFCMQVSLARQSSSFPVGMYYPTTSYSELSSMASGGINFIYADRYVQNHASWYRDLILYADANNIDIIANVRFESVDWCPDDSIISYGTVSPPECSYDSEFEQLKAAVTSVLDQQQFLLDDALIERERITGWLITDEPYARRVRPQYDENGDYDANGTDVPINELKTYTSSLRSFLTSKNYPHKTMYLSEGVSVRNILNPNPNELFIEQDFSEYSESYDVLTVNIYGAAVNKDHTNLYNYTSGTYPTGWYSHSNPSVEEGALRALSLFRQKIDYDLGPDTQKKIHINMVLGEEKNHEDQTLETEYLISHGMTHLAIRTAYELGFDGVSFYPWKHGSLILDDAYCNWTPANPCAGAPTSIGINYSEVVSTEIHDRDWLVTSFSNSTFSQNRTYLSDRGSNFVNTASGTCQGVVGQCPAAGYNENHSTVIKNLASGDLWGEETTDFTYVINNDENRKTIGDGDDELVYTTFARNFWVSEENHTQSLFGNTLNSNQLALSGEEITAMTTGDFDGDGDYEVVTAVYAEYDYSAIYISDDANNFKQKTIYYRDYPSSLPIITALAAGDFNRKGRDYLVTATWDELAKDAHIYISDIAEGESPTSTAVYSNTNSIVYVNAFAAGDFDGDFKDELATAFTTPSGSYSQLTISQPKAGGGTGNPGHGDNRVWESTASYEHITALAAGDFKNERKDYLITALWNSSTNRSNIYQSRPTFDSSGYGEGNPTHTSDPETSHIYQNGTYWHVTAMTAGSFRESLPSGASKVAARSITETGENLPGELYLAQNYPNPFNPTTQITYQVPKQSLVYLEVYNMLGQKVATLVKQDQTPGEYTVSFNARNLASGVYLYILKSGNTQIQKKMLLIK